MTEFERELRGLINRHSVENASNTPDFILACFMAESLTAFNKAVHERARWYGRMDSPGQSANAPLTGAAKGEEI